MNPQAALLQLAGTYGESVVMQAVARADGQMDVQSMVLVAQYMGMGPGELKGATREQVAAAWKYVSIVRNYCVRSERVLPLGVQASRGPSKEATLSVLSSNGDFVGRYMRSRGFP